MRRTWPRPRQIRRALRRYGIKARLCPGWKDRRLESHAGYRGSSSHVRAFVMHDTGTGIPAPLLRTRHSLHYMLYSIVNDAGQPVRAAHFYVDRDGQVWIMTAWRTWHAGRGKAMFGLAPDTLNQWSMGVEIESHGGGVQDLTRRQVDAAARLAAAICDLCDLPTDHVINHKTYAGQAQGKVDTAYSDTFWRDRVRALRQAKRRRKGRR